MLRPVAGRVTSYLQSHGAIAKFESFHAVVTCSHLKLMRARLTEAPNCALYALSGYDHVVFIMPEISHVLTLGVKLSLSSVGNSVWLCGRNVPADRNAAILQCHSTHSKSTTLL